MECEIGRLNVPAEAVIVMALFAFVGRSLQFSLEVPQDEELIVNQQRYGTIWSLPHYFQVLHGPSRR